MTQKQAYLYLIVGAFIISFAPVLARFVQTPSGDFAGMGPTVSAFYRCLIGGLFLVGVVLFQKKSLFLVHQKVFVFLGLAGLFFALDLAAYHRAIVLVGPGLATLLASCQVFILTIIGFLFLREKPNWMQWLAIPLALVGLAMIVGFDWSAIDKSYRWGLILGGLTACCYAAYVLSLRGANKHELEIQKIKNDPIRLMAWASLITMAFLLVFTLGFGESFEVGPPINWLWLILLGIFCQAIAWVFISMSLPYVRAAHVGMIILLQPIFAFIWDVLLFDRPFTQIEFAGATLAVVAIYLGSVSESSKSTDPNE